MVTTVFVYRISTMLTTVPLSRQSNSVLLTLYKHSIRNVGSNGKITDHTRYLLTLLHHRGYDIKKMNEDSK